MERAAKLQERTAGSGKQHAKKISKREQRAQAKTQKAFRSAVKFTKHGNHSSTQAASSRERYSDTEVGVRKQIPLELFLFLSSRIPEVAFHRLRGTAHLPQLIRAADHACAWASKKESRWIKATMLHGLCNLTDNGEVGPEILRRYLIELTLSYCQGDMDVFARDVEMVRNLRQKVQTLDQLFPELTSSSSPGHGNPQQHDGGAASWTPSPLATQHAATWSIPPAPGILPSNSDPAQSSPLAARCAETLPIRSIPPAPQPQSQPNSWPIEIPNASVSAAPWTVGRISSGVSEDYQRQMTPAASIPAFIPPPHGNTPRASFHPAVNNPAAQDSSTPPHLAPIQPLNGVQQSAATPS
uniref:Uncharacterized protein n=1 Tax=Magnaporthiopsis poae (strain ATCC 64411 / 73-15) TaxID=644358 RepID=A0A0C4EDG1_MAGP6